MTLRRVLPVLVLIAVAAAGCGDDEPAAATHNDADVAFAAQMVPHHEQALRMVEMTAGRELSPDFEHLTHHVHDAQQPEIETMTGWLEAWGEEPDEGHAHHSHLGPGMMTEDDFTALEATSRTAFERMWLQMMIEHHEGAIEMARTELDEGAYDPALELAQSIIDAQSHEIEEMEEMLAGQS